MNGRVGCVSIPLHLCHRELRCDVVVVDKNCEAILARAPALAVPFFMIPLKYFPESEKPFPTFFLLLASVIPGLLD